MKKPYIGVVSYSLNMTIGGSEKEHFCMRPGYLNSIEKAGGIGLILPLTKDLETLSQIACDIDGLVLAGGADVDPALYGEQRHATTHEPSKVRDLCEIFLLKKALERNIPIFGICRGFQLLNVALGGSLYQDIDSMYQTNLTHRSPDYDKDIHSVNIVANSLLHTITNKTKIGVNSFHHQAIKTLGKDLEIAGKSDDGLIEAFYIPNKRFALGVQWHPEVRPDDTDSEILFSSFIKECYDK